MSRMPLAVTDRSALLSNLKQTIQGEVRFDRLSRTARGHSFRSACYRMWNFDFTTRPSFRRARYQADTSFIGTHRRSSLR